MPINYVTVATQYAEKHDLELSIAGSYGEPGYDTERDILLSNWNNWPRNLMDRMETAGCSLEWSDEWRVHEDKAYRTSPDCYYWEPSYAITEGGEIITIHDDPEEWYEEKCITDKLQSVGVVPSHLSRLPNWVYLDEPEYETGFFINEIEALKQTMHKLLDTVAEKVVLVRTEQSQFYTRYALAYLPLEAEDRVNH